MPGVRAILHVDMDAFFAAVEILDRPSLRGKPVIVGGTPEGHGVVSTASYEARAYGVRSAMPAAQAVVLCPSGIFLRPRMGRYAAVSRQVFSIFSGVTPLVEPVSVDEAFLDVTGSMPEGPGAAVEGGDPFVAARVIARDLQSLVERETGGLACSIGLAPNKFLAKVASDLEKPRGLVEVAPGSEAEFLAPLPVERLWGVGPRTSDRLRALGLDSIGKLARLEERDLVAIAGEDLGRHLHRLSRGIDDRLVRTDWAAKSVSHEMTFGTFLDPLDQDAIEHALFDLADQVAFRLRQEGLWGSTVKLKARDDRFETCTRALTLPAPTQLVEEIFAAALRLLRERVRFAGRSVRLLGVGVTNLRREPAIQLEMFEPDPGEAGRARTRARVADAIRQKLGDGAIVRGRLVERKERR